MSDTPDLSEPSGDGSKLRPVDIRGQRYCAICYREGQREPNHPEHPNSPYCEYHYKQARNLAKKVWRDRQAERQETLDEARAAGLPVYVATTGQVVLSAVRAEQLHRDLRAWQQTLDEVATALGFAGDNGIGQPMAQRLAQHLSRLAPGLARWRQSLEDRRGDEGETDA